jgi:hypothetical protein
LKFENLGSPTQLKLAGSSVRWVDGKASKGLKGEREAEENVIGPARRGSARSRCCRFPYIKLSFNVIRPARSRCLFFVPHGSLVIGLHSPKMGCRHCTMYMTKLGPTVGDPRNKLHITTDLIDSTDSTVSTVSKLHITTQILAPVKPRPRPASDLLSPVPARPSDALSNFGYLRSP